MTTLHPVFEPIVADDVDTHRNVLAGFLYSIP